MPAENPREFSSLSDLTWEDLGLDQDGIPTESKNPLCIPQDRLEDLDFFPSLNDDLISLNGLFQSPEHKSYSSGRFSSKKHTNTLSLDARENMNMPLFLNDFQGFGGIHNPEELHFYGFKKQESEDKGKGKGKGKEVLYDFLEQTDEKQAIEGRSNRPQSHSRNSSKDMKLRCTHCQAEKTPQWRMGPLGPKTLCNACGVRFKSGRLMPEYRPAASPTFDSTKHSNFHKNILQKFNHLK
ncbi:unnamed protein product [Fraxinus pennsylvanica]|uniref:GATA-type domain-containing protein n=1 Tax=Fraxinus pennsylvanica TaxID=56036 RepID=A0AAD1YLL0_9LAMI|nr:unnamed protein product [Fraxinus pennsylvanica]